MYLSGITYYVLADHFLVHQNHLYEEVTRKNEVLIWFIFLQAKLTPRFPPFSANTTAKYTPTSKKKLVCGVYSYNYYYPTHDAPLFPDISRVTMIAAY
jgi:hypothetical protein